MLISDNSTAVISDNFLSSNFSLMLAYGATARIANNVIILNRWHYRLHGIECWDVPHVDLVNNLICHNVDSSLYCKNSTLNVMNCTFAHNGASNPARGGAPSTASRAPGSTSPTLSSGRTRPRPERTSTSGRTRTRPPSRSPTRTSRARTWSQAQDPRSSGVRATSTPIPASSIPGITTTISSRTLPASARAPAPRRACRSTTLKAMCARAPGVVDIGADEFHPHLYHVGETSPGRTMQFNILGNPGQPVVLAYSGHPTPLEPPDLDSRALGRATPAVSDLPGAARSDSPERSAHPVAASSAPASEADLPRPDADRIAHLQPGSRGGEVKGESAVDPQTGRGQACAPRGCPRGRLHRRPRCRQYPVGSNRWKYQSCTGSG